MNQYSLKIRVEGEVIVQANSAEEASLLVHYADPNLSGTRIIKSTVEVLATEKRSDVILEADNIATFNYINKGSKH